MLGVLGAALLAVTANGVRAAPGLPALAPAAKFETGAGTRSLAEFRGRKVMLWMYSTWCSSCAAGLDALEAHQRSLKRAGVEVIALQNFQNGGYPGPSPRKFVERFARALLAAPNWIFGTVPEAMAKRYNPRRYPDIYFLIDEQGMVRAIEGAPGATMDQILRFVEDKRG